MADSDEEENKEKEVIGEAEQENMKVPEELDQEEINKEQRRENKEAIQPQELKEQKKLPGNSVEKKVGLLLKEKPMEEEEIEPFADLISGESRLKVKSVRNAESPSEIEMVNDKQLVENANEEQKQGEHLEEENPLASHLELEDISGSADHGQLSPQKPEDTPKKKLEKSLDVKERSSRLKGQLSR